MNAFLKISLIFATLFFPKIVLAQGEVPGRRADLFNWMQSNKGQSKDETDLNLRVPLDIEWADLSFTSNTTAWRRSSQRFLEDIYRESTLRSMEQCAENNISMGDLDVCDSRQVKEVDLSSGDDSDCLADSIINALLSQLIDIAVFDDDIQTSARFYFQASVGVPMFNQLEKLILDGKFEEFDAALLNLSKSLELSFASSGLSESSNSNDGIEILDTIFDCTPSTQILSEFISNLMPYILSIDDALAFRRNLMDIPSGLRREFFIELERLFTNLEIGYPLSFVLGFLEPETDLYEAQHDLTALEVMRNAFSVSSDEKAFALIELRNTKFELEAWEEVFYSYLLNDRFYDALDHLVSASFPSPENDYRFHRVFLMSAIERMHDVDLLELAYILPESFNVRILKTPLEEIYSILKVKEFLAAADDFADRFQLFASSDSKVGGLQAARKFSLPNDFQRVSALLEDPFLIQVEALNFSEGSISDKVLKEQSFGRRNVFTATVQGNDVERQNIVRDAGFDVSVLEASEFLSNSERLSDELASRFNE